jgi:hypothetical protein
LSGDVNCKAAGGCLTLPAGTRGVRRWPLSHRAFERDADQLLGFDGELHRQFLDDFLDEAVDDQRDGFFLGNAAGWQ